MATLEDLDRIQAEALKDVNAIRAEFNKPPLKKMPKGKRGTSFQVCSVGRALGSEIAIRVCRDEERHENDPVSGMEPMFLPKSGKRIRRIPSLTRFEVSFEAGYYPELLRESVRPATCIAETK